MKIGIVCYPSLGGSGILATELGHQLAERGHEVHFITYEMPFRLSLEGNGIFFHQVEINRYDLFRYPDYALPLAVTIANVARNHNLDILHVHYAIPHATSAYLARQILGSDRPRIITTLHGTDITLVGRDPSYLDIVRYSIEHSDAVTAVSEYLKKETIDYFGISKPIEVIHNFFIPRPEAGLSSDIHDRCCSGKEKLILHSSNYREVKRPDDVIEVFARIHEKVPSKLLLLGAGSGMEKIRQVVQQKGLNDAVTYLGVSRDIDRYVASSDLFLLPSEQESFGLAALEAMAYGVPVVASDAGGLPELIENGVSGFMAPVGDVAQMAADGVRLLTDSALHAQVSKAAKKRADEQFGIERILPLYEALYARLAK